MPPSHYRRRILKVSNSPIALYIVRSSSTPKEDNLNSELLAFQKYICDIIELISTTLDVRAITLKVEEFMKIINTRTEYYNIIDLIEENILGVVCNVGNLINIGIIRCRIAYIRELIDKIPDSEACVEYSPELSQQIFKLLDSLVNGVDLNTFAANVRSFKNTVQADVDSIKFINEVENIILDIVSNIRDYVNISIIRCRIQYLQEVIQGYNCPD